MLICQFKFQRIDKIYFQFFMRNVLRRIYKYLWRNPTNYIFQTYIKICLYNCLGLVQPRNLVTQYCNPCLYTRPPKMQITIKTGRYSHYNPRRNIRSNSVRIDELLKNNATTNVSGNLLGSVRRHNGHPRNITQNIMLLRFRTLCMPKINMCHLYFGSRQKFSGEDHSSVLDPSFLVIR